jgi:hypothetical protein
MISRRAVLTFAVVTWLFTPPAVRGDDLAEVQAVFARDIRLLNANNKDAFVASAHDEVVLFGILSLPSLSRAKRRYNSSSNSIWTIMSALISKL